MAKQVIERTALAIPGEPGVLDVVLDQAPPFQHATNAGGDLLHQSLQFAQARSCHRTEHRLTSAIGQVIGQIHPSILGFLAPANILPFLFLGAWCAVVCLPLSAGSVA